MYNKKVLSEATKNLNSTKAPAKKKDRVIATKPLVSTQGYKQGPPPAGSHYRIPGNRTGTSIYNPTPYPLNLVGPNGTQAQIGPWDTNTQHFDEPYMDEFQAAYGGDISIPDLTDYEDGGEYDLTDEEIAKLKKGGYVVHELPSIPKKKGSKGYSRSLQATNKLFAQNPLTKKPKSKKRKVFDPDSKYYANGGDFSTDIDKRRQVLRDWTYGESIGMLQKAQVGYQTAPAPTGLIPPKTAAQVQKEELAKGKGPTASAAKAVNEAAKKRAEWEKQEAARKKAEEQQRLRSELNRTAGAGPGSSTYVTPNKIDIPVSSTPLEDKKAIEDYANNLVNTGVAAETLGNRYWDQSGDTDMNQMLLNKIYSDPYALEDIEDAEYRIWKRGEEKAYQNANYFDRALNELQAFTTDAPGQIMRTLEGKRSLMGQGYRSLNPEEYEDSRFYDRALGYDVEGALPFLNNFNPMRYASKAGVDLTKGNVASALGNIGLGALSGTGLGTTAQGLKVLGKTSLPFLSKVPGATYGNLAKAYFPASGAARDLGFDPEDPSSLRVLDRMIAGDMGVGEGLSNIALNSLDYSPIATVGKTPGKIIPRVKLTEAGKEGVQGLKKYAQPVVNLLDKPRFSVSLTKPKLSNLTGINIRKPVAGPMPYGKNAVTPRTWNVSAADALRWSTVGRTAMGLQGLPSYSTAEDVFTSDKPWREKYEDIKDIGRSYGNAALGLAPLAGPVGRSIYGSTPATTAFLADYLNKLQKGDYEGLRGVFPAARILTGKQEGGEYWEEEIDDKRRRELEAQGYIIEDLD